MPTSKVSPKLVNVSNDEVDPVVAAGFTRPACMLDLNPAKTESCVGGRLFPWISDEKELRWLVKESVHAGV
jgi:hypothetical protein